MKKLIVASLLMMGMTTFAQVGKPMRVHDRSERMTPEQRDQLQLKKLSSDLNLDANQQAEMSRIMAERSAKRQEMASKMKEIKEKKAVQTADDRFKRKNEMLDFEIAEKAKIKKVLNAEQFGKWEKWKEAQKQERIKNMEKRKASKMPDDGNE